MSVQFLHEEFINFDGARMSTRHDDVQVQRALDFFSGIGAYSDIIIDTYIHDMHKKLRKR